MASLILTESARRERLQDDCAVQILAVSDSDLAAKLKDTRKRATATVLEKNAAVEAKFNS